MSLTQDEIVSEAARLRAAKRRRVAKACEVCGTPFEGIAQRRYCSAACRMRASRRRQGAESEDHGDDRQAGLGQGGAVMEEHGGANGTVAGAVLPGEEPVRGILRAEGKVDENESQPAPRGEIESMIDYLERVSDYVMGGRSVRFPENSVEDIRASREERSEEVRRAIEGAGSAAMVPKLTKAEADAILAQLDRTRERIMRGRVFADDSTEIVRRERERRSSALLVGSDQ